MGKQNFGGSLLPSHDSSTYAEIMHSRGALKVIPLPEIEEHMLMFRWPDRETFIPVATHSNGFSCKALAERIIRVWDGSHSIEHALAQFDYIADCGGMVIKQSRFVEILSFIKGEPVERQAQ